MSVASPAAVRTRLRRHRARAIRSRVLFVYHFDLILANLTDAKITWCRENALG